MRGKNLYYVFFHNNMQLSNLCLITTAVRMEIIPKNLEGTKSYLLLDITIKVIFIYAFQVCQGYLFTPDKNISVEVSALWKC